MDCPGSQRAGRDRPKIPGSRGTEGEQGRPGPDAAPEPATARLSAGSTSLKPTQSPHHPTSRSALIRPGHAHTSPPAPNSRPIPFPSPSHSSALSPLPFLTCPLSPANVHYLSKPRNSIPVPNARRPIRPAPPPAPVAHPATRPARCALRPLPRVAASPRPSEWTEQTPVQPPPPRPPPPQSHSASVSPLTFLTAPLAGC